jgi:hypothetical protein
VTGDSSSGDDELVEVVIVGALEADVIVARLRDAGIEAVAFGAGDMRLTASEGSRVMVRRRDLASAQEVLDA